MHSVVVSNRQSIDIHSRSPTSRSQIHNANSSLLTFPFRHVFSGIHHRSMSTRSSETPNFLNKPNIFTNDYQPYITMATQKALVNSMKHQNPMQKTATTFMESIRSLIKYFMHKIIYSACAQFVEIQTELYRYYSSNYRSVEANRKELEGITDIVESNVAVQSYHQDKCSLSAEMPMTCFVMASITATFEVSPVSALCAGSTMERKTASCTASQPDCFGLNTFSVVDSKPSYCYFTISSSPLSDLTKRCNLRRFGRCDKRFNKLKMTECNDDSDANNNSFCDSDIDDFPQTQCYIGQSTASRRKTLSESSDDNFIVFLNEDNESDKDFHLAALSECSDDDSYMDSDTDSDSLSSAETDDCDDLDYNTYCLNTLNMEKNTHHGPIEKKVRFDLAPVVHVMHTWNYAYRSARKGHWEDFARDRVRFQNRIQRASEYLNPILTAEHRNKIFAERFAQLDN